MKTETINALRQLQEDIHHNNAQAGWWTDLKIMEMVGLSPDHFLSKLCLVHSEVSEACEGFRKNLKDDHIIHRDMAEVELADAVIRILDLAGGYGLDVAGAMADKLEYNKKRADHKIENRLKDGGKLV